jgi:hypothetical protein
VSASSQQSTQQAWKAFDENNSGTPPAWLTIDPSYNGSTYLGSKNLGTDTGGNSTTVPGEYIILQMPNKVKLKHFKLKERFGHSGSAGDRAPAAGKIYGSNDGTHWSEVNTFSGLTYTDNDDVFTTVNVDSSIAYNRFALVVTAINVSQDDWVGISDLRYYGYEEDPPAGDTSVDTTFTSIMNTPQTTGANVYVDGNLGETFTNRVTGPTVSNTHTTYVSAEKYWELSGNVESNVTIEANTFLSGDQPHAVSVWFNSSNLEANVSNTCVFSISDQEKLDSVNLDLQSNTWHNLTYAYQGEGGSRVTYLDGRKVAEDQAEDTFGDYPPFAMTGYSQGGYVVSASNFQDGDYYPWEAFDKSGDLVGWYTGDTAAYNGTNGAVTTSSTVRLAPETEKGEWLQIEFPSNFNLNYFVLYSQSDSPTINTPDNFILYAKKNSSDTWTSLGTYTGTAAGQSAAGYTGTVDGSEVYKYFAIVVTKRFQSSGANGVAIRELKLYGHRENDLVRLPDPTNVLKYPHVTLDTSNGRGMYNNPAAKRGYVVTASTYGAGGREPVLAFDGDTSTLWYGGFFTDSGGAEGSSPNQFFLADGSGQTVTDASSTVHYGSWLTLELPHKLQVSSIKIRSTGNSNGARRRFKGGKLFGSNTHNPTSGTISGNYYQLGSRFDFATSSTDEATFTINATTAYKYITLLGDSCWYDGTNDEKHFYIHDYQIFGTQEGSVPIQIGGGNIDRVANFRVYDKFIDENQALEIWDAQKDAFGRAKSSMTLHKGRLGIGTTEPEGRLAVLDEPNGLEEFPPRAMTGYKNYFEGHGEFCVSASSETNTVRVAWKAFDKFLDVSSSDHTWTNNSNPNYNGADNTYNPSVDGIILGTGAVYGEWIKLELPYKINLKYMKMNTRAPNDLSRMPEDFKVYGSNDNSNWTELISVTGRATVFETIHNVHTDSMYKYFGVVVTKISGQNNYFRILELRYFGTREQGQSVLHDGQLTLTKNLNVPRIGPALDADDTPRRDRLVVEYNTTTNPTFEGAVRDTSGRGNDGVFYGGASYDATEKALVFDGTASDQYVHTLKNGTSESGNINYSVSLWFNPTTVNVARWRAVFAVGVLDRSQPTDNSNDEISLFVKNGGNALHLQNGDNSVETGALNAGQWVHVVVTYDGTNRKIYLDGSLSLSNGYTSLNLPKEMLIRLAQSIPAGGSESDEYMDCKISNFKTWFGASLTAEEVKTLYDMGRCDEGHHVVNFSKTRVGIGLGDGEAPRGALDVRDEVYINKQVGPLELRQVVDNTPLQSFIIRAATSGFGYWGMYVSAGNDFSFHQNGSDRGYLANGSNEFALDFTGQHRNFIDGIPATNYTDFEGLIVSANKNKYYDIDENITAGANAIQISQSLPLVALSNVALDKACFGVISGVEDPDTRKYEQGTFVTVLQKQRGDRRAFINSVGEGAIWVVNTNGSLESGDYITTSNVAGYGQKQNDDVLHNYTVAKITMDCDFEPVTQPVQQILRSNVVETYYLGNVHKVKNVPHEFVTTVVGTDDDWSNVSVSPSDVTYAEWSNLEANTQNTYTLTYTQTSNVVYDTKYTLTTTANVTESDAWDRVFIDPPNVSYAEYSNLEANTQNTYTLTFTQTTTDTKTPEEWSALESNTQSLYNKVYYQSVEEEVAATWPGAVAHTRVTDVIENELDEHGQIQWEDHPTETEKAYKIRYLDANGVETDEASHVYKAAFVGCTYHCG